VDTGFAKRSCYNKKLEWITIRRKVITLPTACPSAANSIASTKAQFAKAAKRADTDA
jgi:hypothetical protein